MIRAILFDFDGLILDTESAEFQAWHEIYQAHGCQFSLDEWGKIIGGSGSATFDAAAHLEKLVGRLLDHDALNARWRLRGDELIASLPLLPGVEHTIRDARRRKLRLAIASSSSHAWVDGHLQRLGLFHFFEVVRCAGDVQKTKPHPDLFLAALQGLNVPAGEAIALEDSPNGVLAAKRAGVFVIAVPNPLTRRLDLSQADLILDTLDGFSLLDFLRQFNI